MRFAARRRWCRGLFCTLCLLPTLLVLTASFVVHSPTYQAARMANWQASLSARLGLDARVTAIEWRGRDHWIVHGLELNDPESRAWLARARCVTVRRGDEGSLVSLVQPEVDFRRMPRLVDILHEHLLLRPSRQRDVWKFVASSLVVHDDRQPETLLGLRATLEAGEDATEVIAEFRSSLAAQGEPARLRVVRNRQLDPPATGWELQAGPHRLPCRLLQAWLPVSEYLGDHGTFQGSVRCERSASGWEAEISGDCRQLDLDRLVTAHFPHKLSGMAELTLRRLVVCRGRIMVAEGELRSPGGVISQSLLAAAEQYLGLKRYTSANDALLLPYQELSLQFALNEQRCVVQGRNDSHRVVLADAHGPLLGSLDDVEVLPQAVVQLLVPRSDLQVPAAKETTTLLRILPLPEADPSQPRQAHHDYAPLRLRRE